MRSDFSENDSSLSSIPNNTILIIFGASGDLTRRKLMPALYHLARESLIPDNFHIIGIGRRIQEGKEFIIHMQNRVRQYCSHKMEKRYWNTLSTRMSSIKSDYKNELTYKSIHQTIIEKSKKWGTQVNKIFYLATSPSHFNFIVKNIVDNNLHIEEIEYWTRFIIEKPFGLNLQNALALNSEITSYISENQIYRIDHFLGKEAVQNILIFRKLNIIFQPLWNNKFIEHIQITSSETIGVEGRVGFFEQTGAIRDMIQSHLLQILALITMELPDQLDPEIIRDEKVKIFKSIRKYSNDIISNSVIRGQYIEGVVNSELVRKYLDEEGVPPNSCVETYASIKLFIDNPRWIGIPFYLRTGKRMPNRKTEIFIQLKQLQGEGMSTILSKQKPIINTIRLEVQPRAGIDITIGWKPTGLLTDVEPSTLTLGGKADIKEPKSYERLLVDAMLGDSTLFIRFDEIVEMWKIVDPIVEFWKEQDSLPKEKQISTLHLYPAGTQGPKASKSFIRRDGYDWNKV